MDMHTIKTYIREHTKTCKNVYCTVSACSHTPTYTSGPKMYTKYTLCSIFCASVCEGG